MPIRLTAHDVANTARMTRALHRGPILIVEADPDARVYQRVFDAVQCRVIPACGKDNALGALALLEAGSFAGVAAITDRDFCKLDRLGSPSPNALLTDTHDLETMLLASGALESVLSEFGSARKLKTLGRPVRDVLLEAALPIGVLRWLSSPQKDDLGLRFKRLRFYRFVDDRTLAVNVDKLIREVRANSHRPTPTPHALKRKLNALMTTAPDPWHACSGHDLVHILSIGLRSVFGNRKAERITPDVLEAMLRLSYEYRDFRNTRLYTSIRRWEKANRPFRVLPGEG